MIPRAIKRFFCICLLLLLPLQSSAMLETMAHSEFGLDLAHELEHLAGVNHHHDAHGVIHYDDSAESAQHHAAHASCAGVVALPSRFHLPPLLTLQAAPPPEFGQVLPEPILETPHRPPRHLG